VNDYALPPGWSNPTLGALVQEISSVDPAETPDADFTYFDISSIDNASGLAVSPKVLRGQNAPSRARQAVVPGDILSSGSHAPAWEQVATLQRRVAFGPLERPSLHSYAGAWEREADE
jgi:hypothetical protein